MKQAYNDNRKRQDLKRLCQVKRFKIAPALAGGGYFTFIVNIIKNTIDKKSILNMYFFIIITLTIFLRLQQIIQYKCCGCACAESESKISERADKLSQTPLLAGRLLVYR